MEVLDQAKETVENIVNDVTTNLSGVQEKAEERYGKVLDNVKTAWNSLKDELDNQSSHVKEYSDRIKTKANKQFKEFDREETYSERAARTRIGKRLERFGASVYAEFCLGDPVPLREVVEHVVEDATGELIRLSNEPEDGGTEVPFKSRDFR